MRLSPAYEQAVAAEQERRRLAYLPIAQPITLHVRARTVEVPVVYLTPCSENELLLAGNGFLVGRRPLRGDVFQLLWRVSPDFSRPRWPMWVQAHPGCRSHALSHWRSLLAYGCRAGLAHARLGRIVDRCRLNRAERSLRAWIGEHYEDEPAQRVERGTVVNPHRPLRCKTDAFVQHFVTAFHLTPTEVLNTPIPLLLQWHRDRLIASGESLSVIDRSMELVGTS
ncbi:MAG TPA: hypothetical protein VHF69_11680 [Candidatus Synoicihabitans sp.]|nr:hypothetical protein [Candidatus Synoicihabitans sp.]